MPKQDKTPKKKSKKKSPQKSGETEYPAMDQEEYNRLLQNAIEQIKAEAEQKFEERLKAVEADREAQIKVAEDRLTKKFDDEVREVLDVRERRRTTTATRRLPLALGCRPLGLVRRFSMWRGLPGEGGGEYSV